MKVPFLSLLECEKSLATGQWSLVEPSIPTMKHAELVNFNWTDVHATSNLNQAKYAYF